MHGSLQFWHFPVYGEDAYVLEGRHGGLVGTKPAWNAYLNRHFRPSAARGVRPRGLGVGSGLSARDMVVPLGLNHHPPP